ncbi:aspartic peptidase domain-containing protein [Xylariomycetidae sp. FL2044]|nr:aspartic peptidase domain-containing protein [Xylariomycetidae sp. FL2044]
MGQFPPVDVSTSSWATVQILVADLIHKDVTSWQPSFYAFVPDFFVVGQDWLATGFQFPFILDTSTAMMYLPPLMAEAVNARFRPNATYMWEHRSYFTDCDAVAPVFAVVIGGTRFPVNPLDLINREVRDPETGLCQTAVASGGSGPYILGDAFLKNVVVAVDAMAGHMTFYTHEFD